MVESVMDKDSLQYTQKIRETIKKDTNFAILNLVNTKGKISLTKIDEMLGKPQDLGISLKQLTEFSLINESFERKSPLQAYFELDKLGRIVLDNLSINKKQSEEFLKAYKNGNLGEEINKIIP